jgi:uncharacterized protein (TIGR02246 family)
MRGALANGERILALRLAAGLTQERLATDCRCDVKTIRGAERSKRMDAATLRRIADRLGIRFSEVIADDPGRIQDDSIAVVDRFHRAFNTRDPDAVALCFTEDGAVIVYADPRLPGSGEFRGRAQVREWAGACFAAYVADKVDRENREIRAVGNYVFVRVVRSNVRSLQTGQEAAASLMSEFECAAGGIALLRIYPESGAIERIALDVDNTDQVDSSPR